MNGEKEDLIEPDVKFPEEESAEIANNQIEGMSTSSQAAPGNDDNAEQSEVCSALSDDPFDHVDTVGDFESLVDAEISFHVESLEETITEELDVDDELAAERIRIIASDESVVIEESKADSSGALAGELASDSDEVITATREELKPAIESILFVADEPLSFKQLCKILGDVVEEDVRAALDELIAGYDSRQSGLEIREIAGGWRISTRPQNHEFIRKYLKSRPTARLSLPALETLAVIAYKQPITVPEILEIRGVTSSSAIKTLLEKRLIVTKGRKETVGRPMLYGTSREFLIQFGLKDLTELPSIEDFEDLAQ